MAAWVNQHMECVLNVKSYMGPIIHFMYQESGPNIEHLLSGEDNERLRDWGTELGF